MQLFSFQELTGPTICAACQESDKAFAEQHQLTELARLHADNARSMLEIHRMEHGC